MESAAFASMLDSGNFVLQNIHSDIIWSSFSLPTDTILGDQNLPGGSELFSRLSETNHSTGRFRLKMQGDGNLVLYPTNTIDEYTEAYWATNTYRIQHLHLYLNYTGELVLVDNNLTAIRKLYSEPALNKSSTIISRATLDVDGVFRLYYHFYVTEGVYNTTVKWKEPEDLCLVKTFCGLNSYCTSYDDQPICRCLPGTDFVDSSEMSGGCERSFVDQTCKGMNRSREILYNMTLMEKMTWDDYPYSNENMGEEDCKRSCLEDCNCDAVLYKSSSCLKQKLPLKSARRDQGESSSFIAYFKTGQRNITSNDNGNNFSPVQPQTTKVVTSKKAITLILVLSLGFITGSCVFLAISGFFIFKYRVAKYKWLLKTGKFGLNDELTLRSFSYYELKKATKGFREELGRGSFGAVYKGSFYRGEKLVAVKRLEKLVNDGSEREFRAEMLVIGRIHHKNLVGLLGYCYEDSKRLLVYEYMSNGSLADLLFRAERSPDWNERVRIALEVARGILYLHDECEAPIIHCDIKPQNILMDDFWTAKISDFGLAKLLLPDC